MLGALDPTVVTVIVAIITALIAPTWLSWWNTRQTKKEFKPNGGSSIKDSLNRLEVSVAATRQTSLTLASVIGVAYFQADADGDYVFVSRDWQRMAGMFAEDAMGTGWVHAIAPMERERVTSAWVEAVRTVRPFNEHCSLAGGVRVHITATPIKAVGGVVEGFVGFFEAVEAAEMAPGFP